MSSAIRRTKHARQKALRDKRRGSFYTGGPRPDTTKAERTKQSKVVREDRGRPVVLPLRIKPNGHWGYRFSKIR